MKREIKFKVFDGSDYMSSPFTFQDIFEGKVQFTQDCPLLQFTGLKDKNGKEVYEGDVFSCFPMEIDGKVFNINKHIVGFENGAFGYMDATGSYFIGFQQNKNFQWINETSLEIEIIGNIYENKELITH